MTGNELELGDTTEEEDREDVRGAVRVTDDNVDGDGEDTGIELETDDTGFEFEMLHLNKDRRVNGVSKHSMSDQCRDYLLSMKREDEFH